MLKVTKKPNESDESLINRFRNKVNETGIIWDMRKKDRHVKDAEKRKERKKERDRLIKQKERKNKR